jgi:hypothetical protein
MTENVQSLKYKYTIKIANIFWDMVQFLSANFNCAKVIILSMKHTY